MAPAEDAVSCVYVLPSPVFLSPEGAADSAQGQRASASSALGFQQHDREANPKLRYTPNSPAASAWNSAPYQTLSDAPSHQTPRFLLISQL